MNEPESGASWGVRPGLYRVARGRLLRLLAPGRLVLEGGSLRLTAREDPRGSALWLLLYLFPSFLLASRFQDKGAGILWAISLFPAYVAIQWIRRRRVEIDVGASERIVLDRKKGVVALRTTLGRRSGWVSFRVKREFESAAAAISELEGSRIEEGRALNVGLLPTLLLILLAAALFLLLRSLV